MIGIYKITSPSKRVYIGQSVNIELRWNQYQNNYKHTLSQVKLIRSFEKYGVETHDFEVIEECSQNELNERERYWQDYYNVLHKGLNCKLTKTADKSGHLSEETKKKISLANKVSMAGRKPSKKANEAASKKNKGKKRSQEVRNKISQASLGKKHSKITKEKMSNAHRGKVLPEETKTKIGKSVAKALKGRKLSEEHKNNLSSERRERAFNRNGYLLAIDPITDEIQYKFLSPAEAKEYGYDGGSIGASMKYGWKHKGFIWRYEKK